VIRLLAVRYGAIEKPPQLTTVCTLAAGKLDRRDGRVRLLDVFTAPATEKATALLGTPRRTDWRLQPPAGQVLIRHHSRHLQSALPLHLMLGSRAADSGTMPASSA
jgi:hypothetical protein